MLSRPAELRCGAGPLWGCPPVRVEIPSSSVVCSENRECLSFVDFMCRAALTHAVSDIHFLSLDILVPHTIIYPLILVRGFLSEVLGSQFQSREVIALHYQVLANRGAWVGSRVNFSFRGTQVCGNDVRPVHPAPLVPTTTTRSLHRNYLLTLSGFRPS